MADAAGTRATEAPARSPGAPAGARRGDGTGAGDPDRPHGALSRWLPSPLLRASALLHLVTAALLLARPRLWRPAAALAVADHLLLLGASLIPRSTLLGPNLSRLPADPRGSRRVALTFDDGPDPAATPRVLDLLDAAGARASFFCIGRRAEAHPDLVREIVRRGHRVENHTHRHSPLFAVAGAGSMGREIDRAQDLLADLAGRPPAWFRPPAGMRSPLLHGILAGRGLGLATWTRRGYDAVSRNPRAVTRRLLRGLGEGDVLLLHDGSSPTLPGGRRLVLEVLPAVLEALAAADLEAVSLPAPPSTAAGSAAA